MLWKGIISEGANEAGPLSRPRMYNVRLMLGNRSFYGFDLDCGTRARGIGRRRKCVSVDSYVQVRLPPRHERSELRRGAGLFVSGHPPVAKHRRGVSSR